MELCSGWRSGRTTKAVCFANDGNNTLDLLHQVEDIERQKGKWN